jgi:hypothetical protein
LVGADTDMVQNRRGLCALVNQRDQAHLPDEQRAQQQYRVDAGHQRNQLLRALDRAKPQAKMPHASYLRNAWQMYERGVR